MEIRAYPKVNICFKITNILQNGYCEIASRFVLVESANLCDTIEIRNADSFQIDGNFSCTMQENTIFKAKEALGEFLETYPRHSEGDSPKNLKKMRESLEFFSVEVDKKIPAFAGLGGGSSDAASYLKAINEILELNLSQRDLMRVGAKVGADVSFFLYDKKSANVFGIGDGVEFFSEDSLEFEFIVPPIQCSTKAVYDEFRAMKARGEVAFFTQGRELLKKDSISLLRENTIDFLNDLYVPACRIYPNLHQYAKDGYFFSGSGSSFFRIKDSSPKLREIWA
ncbi:4-(cytidine 5'-diphospho)-2-C-methyl-D-erythritol kinase [Helicobacter sp. 23-1044]